MTEATPVRVALTFDYDALSNWVGSSGAPSPGMISRGGFGPIGMGRILALLDSRGIKSTFFMPGHTARAYPRTVQAIQAAGHEIGHHGWVHENPVGLSPEREKQVMVLGLEALQEIAGVRPVGYRSPGWDKPVRATLSMQFSASGLTRVDFEPYWCRVGDVYSQTDAFQWGNPVNLVELPVAWHLDDFIQFEFVATPTAILNAARSTTMSWEIWKAEFDYLYQRVGRGLMTITMHPQVIGRGHRMLLLEQFIDYVAGHTGAAFTTLGDYQRQWRVAKTPALPRDAG